MQIIKKCFNFLENSEMSFRGWVLALLSITFVRGFLENFSGRHRTDVFSTDTGTFVHYTLFYFFIITTLLLIVHLFVRKDIIKTAKVFLFGSLLVITPPIVDFVITKGNGFFFSYLFGSKDVLFENYFKFYLVGVEGVSMGIRLEFTLLFILTFLYVYVNTKSLVRSLCSIFAVYTTLFLFFASPVFLAVSPTFDWLISFKDSLIARSYLHPGLQFSSLMSAFEMYFNVIISQIFYIGLIFTTLIISLLWNKSKTVSMVRNSRFERVSHYFFMITLGVLLAAVKNNDAFITSFYDVMTLTVLYLSFYFVWMFSVCVNDVVDYASDCISNTDRPLTSGLVSKDDMKNASIIFSVFAVLGGYIVGHYAFYMILTFIFLSYIYSCPPLHLKRFVFVNSFIIALAALTAMVAGFFTVSNNPHIYYLPTNWVVLIVVVYMLFANIKDIKDIDGDAFVRVYTLPVLFGLRRSKIIIAVLCAISLCLIPLVSGLTVLWYLAPLFSLASFYVLLKEVYNEKHVFVLYFAYLIAALVLAVL